MPSEVKDQQPTEAQTSKQPENEKEPLSPLDRGDVQFSASTDAILSAPTSPCSLNADAEGSFDGYDFDAFLARMRHPSCKPILENIKRFLGVFYSKISEASMEDLVEGYRSFYSVMRVKLLQTAAWNGADVSAAERANASEGIESLIMNQLHDKVLAAIKNERKLDNLLEHKMALYGGWIELVHLDVPEEMALRLKESEESWIYTALTEFQRISCYRTPRDKLVCILNGCRVLNSLIQSCGPMSADDFLPILIYTLIRANPPGLNSSLIYISRFRDPERIGTGETAYFFTNMLAAVEFIRRMGRDTLTIDSAAFEAHMDTARATFAVDEDRESSSSSLDRNLDLAEERAELFISKAREAFKSTGERANQALTSLKQSVFAQNIRQFVQDLKTPATAEGSDALAHSLISMDSSVATFAMTDDFMSQQREHERADSDQ